VAVPLLAVAGLMGAGVALASERDPVVAIEGMAYNVEWSIADNLKALKGKRVTITLDSGHQVNGRIKEVGPNLVHLEALGQKDFMDALLRIDAISGIESQFRAYQRDLERMKQREAQ
jgi:hypothetical protein